MTEAPVAVGLAGLHRSTASWCRDLARDCVAAGDRARALEGLRRLEAHLLAAGVGRDRPAGPAAATWTAPPSTSAATSRSRSARTTRQRTSSTARSRRSSWSRGRRAAAGGGPRRGRADAAADDPADAHLPAGHRRRHRLRASPASTACTPTSTPTGRATTSSSSSTRATWPSCGSGPGWSRPSCGAPAAPCTSAPGATRQGTELTLVRGGRPALGPAARRPGPPAQRGRRDRLRRRASKQRHRRARRARRDRGRDRPAAGPAPRLVAQALGASDHAAGPRGGAERRRRPAPGPGPRCCAGAARFVTVTGTTSGTPDLVVGSRLTLERRRRAVRGRRLLRHARCGTPST